MMHRSTPLLLLALCIPACSTDSAADREVTTPSAADDPATEVALGDGQTRRSGPASDRGSRDGGPPPLASVDFERTGVELDAPIDAATPAATDTACAALASEGGCEHCVCESCPEALADCAATPGCPEIMACALQTGCTATDCFCGDASLTGCLDGEANGPCRDVIVAAPGGRAPTLTQPSAGPAAEAARAVAECAENAADCSSLCFED